MTPEERDEEKLAEYRRSRAAIWADDFGELGRYRDANALLRVPAPGENRIVFMGDSLTDGWNLAEYFPGKPYINRGIGGQTTPQMLIRFRPDVIALQPKVVLILAGTNDIAGNTGAMRMEDIKNNFATMAELSRLHGIYVILCSLLPVHNYGSEAELRLIRRPIEKILELNRGLREYAVQNDCQYLDYFSAVLDENGLLKRGMAEDGLHPNAMGYEAMAPLAQAAIERALAAAQGRE